MKNLFKQEDLDTLFRQNNTWPEDMALRVYTSRLLGSCRDLVLHGGGNTSVKLQFKDIYDKKNDVIFVKGSGHDLSTIDINGFTGLYLKPLQKLLQLESITDLEMDNQLKTYKINSQSPDPSVEALLHAFLPHKFVDHTHANNILVLTNQKNGKDLIKESLGNNVAILPYVKSGFPLAVNAIKAHEKNPDMDAIIILNHGIFTFAEDAKTAYDNMIRYVNMAETYIDSQMRKSTLKNANAPNKTLEHVKSITAKFANLVRGICCHKMGDGRQQRFYVAIRNSQDIMNISLSSEARSICDSGVLTPDHVIQTKNKIVYIDSVPSDELELKKIIVQAVETFKKNYHHYFNKQEKEINNRPEELDPYPRLFLVAGVGLVALGKTRKESMIAADIGEQTIKAKKQTFAFGEYHPISDSHIFEMEYWSLQQKKIRHSADLLQGQVAVITGGGGAIGFGIADRLLHAGACVVLTDIDHNRLEKSAQILIEKYDHTRVNTMVFDVTHFQEVEKAYENISLEFGGIDIVVPNAGIAHVATIEDLDPHKLDQVIAVNLKGTFTVIKASIPIFKRQGIGGNIVVISSKNVFDPGAAFGAYSASKAGAHQISKIAAIELAELGVRVNMVNPDAVFGDEKVCSGLWETIGPDRMKSRGLDPKGLQDYYCQRSLLKTQVLAEHVGNAVVFFAGNLTPTTGAALPVDAGNPSTFSR